MNRLSRGARTMLGRQARRQTIRKREAVIQHITRSGLPVFEPIVAFQAQYGGIEYVVRGAPTTGFSFDLFMGFELIDPWAFDTRRDASGRWCFCCGEHMTAQLGFYIAQDGDISVEIQTGLLLPIATSIEKYIESDAMLDGLMDIQSKWWEISFDVAATDRKADPVVSQGRTEVVVASDTYTTWWADKQSRVVRFTMYYPDATNRVTAYLPTRDAAIELAEALSPVLGKLPEIFSYPYDVEEHREANRRRRGLTG